MTKIKLCGMKRLCDIECANELCPDYVGFVLTEGFKRTISYDTARQLRNALRKEITPVGVFVNENIENIKRFIDEEIISVIQLHGKEDDEYISRLRKITDKPIIKAFTIKSESDIMSSEKSTADFVLLDSGTGTGRCFDHSLVLVKRSFFLAGGLTPENVGEAIKNLNPFAVDASSSLETDGIKDKQKMAAFVGAVRKADKNGK